MAGDQAEIVLPKTKWIEETSFLATAYFRTRSTKAAATPTTVHYRVDDLQTGKELTDWTSVTPGTSVTISITPTHNEIQDDAAHFERKQLIVQADQGLSTQFNAKAIWQVENLHGIT